MVVGQQEEGSHQWQMMGPRGHLRAMGSLARAQHVNEPLNLLQMPSERLQINQRLCVDLQGEDLQGAGNWLCRATLFETPTFVFALEVVCGRVAVGWQASQPTERPLITTATTIRASIICVKEGVGMGNEEFQLAWRGSGFSLQALIVPPHFLRAEPVCAACYLA